MPLGRAGALGLAQGVADGVWGLAISPVAATLEAGTMVFSTVEAAALGADLHRPPPRLRPARSFFSSARLLPLAQCIRSSRIGAQCAASHHFNCDALAILHMPHEQDCAFSTSTGSLLICQIAQLQRS